MADSYQVKDFSPLLVLSQAKVITRMCPSNQSQQIFPNKPLINKLYSAASNSPYFSSPTSGKGFLSIAFRKSSMIM